MSLAELSDRIVLQFGTCATSWQSTLICKLSHSPFSHVDYVCANGLLGASDSPNCPVVEGNPHGVAVRTPDYQEFAIRRRAVIKTDKAVQFDALMRSQLGAPFDGDALYAFFSNALVPRDWRQPDKWFCSELIAWALEAAGLFPYKLLVAKNRVSPTDLLLLLNPYIDVESFWLPVPGLKLGAREK